MHEDTLNVAGSRGYIWFMALNIVFCLWLIVRSISPDVKNLVTTDLNFYYFSILAISTLVVTVNNIVKNKKNICYLLCITVITLLGILWSAVFYKLAVDYSNTIVMPVLLIIILLPATIALYISSFLLVIFSAPLVISLTIIILFLGQKLNFYQISGIIIIFGVVFSARIILREWYLRTRMSEDKNKLLIEKLYQEANVDSLTGLGNRRHLYSFFECKTRTLAPDEKIFAIVIDIDFFKQYNDLYGHIAGDKCLRDVANCIYQSVRKEKDGVFRFGGEEFVILTSGNDRTSPERIAARLTQNLQKAGIIHKGSSVDRFLTFSAGIARWEAGMSIDKLLVLADQALYKAKQSGRNTIICNYDESV